MPMQGIKLVDVCQLHVDVRHSDVDVKPVSGVQCLHMIISD